MSDLTWLRAYLKARSGLDLPSTKRYLAESRLGPLWRDAGLGSLAELVGRLRASDNTPLHRAVVEAMTTNETSFFRDRPAFDALRTIVLPRLIEARSGRRRLAVWSAAASTGQEAYSVAMLLADMAPALAGWTVSILATDISPAVIGRARTGTYSQLEVQRGLPIGLLLRHFEQGPDGWTISPELRRTVDFRVLNLLDDTRRLGRFDLILCRNLLIYLDARTKAEVIAKLSAALVPDGVLCLGATESLMGYAPAMAPDPAAPGFVVHRMPERLAS